MRVFDFDNTIYNGESVFDFYLFSIKKNPKVIKLPFCCGIQSAEVQGRQDNHGLTWR